jgi:hypothetical protein
MEGSQMKSQTQRFVEQVYGRPATEQDFAFATLVREAERQACADCCEHEAEYGYNNAMQIGAANCALAIYGRDKE